MFSCRGRGKPLPVRSCAGFINHPKPGPICISKEKTLSVVLSKRGRGGGTYTQIVVERNAAANQDEADCDSLAALSTFALLDEGVFSMPNDHLLDNAPDRVLMQIFTFIDDVKTLAVCENVCRRWRKILTSSHFSYKGLLRLKVKTMKFEICNVTTLTCHAEKNLTPNSGNIGDFDYYNITWKIPRVHARNSYIVETASKIFDKFKIVSAMGFVDLWVSDDLLNRLVQMQKSVKQLRFLRCFIDSNALASLDAIRGIKELAIDHCYGFGDAISSKSILPILQRNVFKRLELSGANVLANVDNTVMEALLTNWKYDKFDFLKLTNCPKITTDAIARVVKHYVRQSEKSRLIVFLKNTGFDVDKFLTQETSFRKKTSTPTTQRVCLEYDGVLIWVEK